MDPLDRISAVASDGIAAKLTAHKEKEREHVEALLGSQKHLTSNVRTLINSLDQVLLLASPKFSSSQPDLLRSVVARARLLRKQLDVISTRIHSIQTHLQGCQTAEQPPCSQPTEMPQQHETQQQQLQQQQQQNVMSVAEQQQERRLPLQQEGAKQAATLPAHPQQQPLPQG